MFARELRTSPKNIVQVILERVDLWSGARNSKRTPHGESWLFSVCLCARVCLNGTKQLELSYKRVHGDLDTIERRAAGERADFTNDNSEKNRCVNDGCYIATIIFQKTYFVFSICLILYVLNMS